MLKNLQLFPSRGVSTPELGLEMDAMLPWRVTLATEELRRRQHQQKLRTLPMLVLMRCIKMEFFWSQKAAFY